MKKLNSASAFICLAISANIAVADHTHEGIGGKDLIATTPDRCNEKEANKILEAACITGDCNKVLVESALNLCPSHINANIEMGRLEFIAHQYYNAVSHFELSIYSSCGTSGDAWLALGLAKEHLNESEAALYAFFQGCNYMDELSCSKHKTLFTSKFSAETYKSVIGEQDKEFKKKLRLPCQSTSVGDC